MNTPKDQPDRRRASLLLGSLVLAAAVLPATAGAQTWPDRTVNIILPYPPGGTVDTQARIVADRLQARLGKPFVVQSKAGAAGALATEFVARAEPDGYTVLFGSSAQTTSVPMTEKVNYRLEDLVPVSPSGRGPMVLAISSQLPAKTLREFIDLMRASPGKYHYATSGAGSVGHLVGAYFVADAKLDLQHVPYRGGGPAVTALLGGQVAMYFANSAELLPHKDSDRIRLIGVSPAQRMKQLPDVPAVGELLKGFELTAWQGFLLPAKTPRPIVDRLAAEVQAITKEPAVIDRLNAVGVEPLSMGPAEFMNMIRREHEPFSKAVAAAGLKK
jgi:tripartite-type tricarboxylate transporter receptor subunit TctC